MKPESSWGKLDYTCDYDLLENDSFFKTNSKLTFSYPHMLDDLPLNDNSCKSKLFFF